MMSKRRFRIPVKEGDGTDRQNPANLLVFSSLLMFMVELKTLVDLSWVFGIPTIPSNDNKPLPWQTKGVCLCLCDTHTHTTITMSAKLTLPFEETILNKHTTRYQDLFASNFRETCGTQHESSSDWVAYESRERGYAADESGESGYADQAGEHTTGDEGWDYPTSNVFLVVLQSGDEKPIYSCKSSFSLFSILYYTTHA